MELQEVNFKRNAWWNGNLCFNICNRISEWPQFARVSRAATLVEKNKDYVSASTIIGVSNLIIMFKHILPNILRPVLV